MSRQTADEFDQELLDLFDRYVHGLIDRRGFLTKAAKFSAAGVTATMLLDALSPNYALAEQIKPGDARIKSERVTYNSPKGHGSVSGLMVRPAAGGQRGSVVVVHENRGLNPYIEDVARRVAVAGFNALAPDGLSSLGGYPGNDSDGRTMQSKLDGGKLLQDFFAAYDRLETDAASNGKIGVVGFCYGGGVANAMAVAKPGLAAAAPFYGRQPQDADVAKINASLSIHYAGLDRRINGGWPAFEASLKAHGKTYSAHIYEGVNHGFHNDTTPRYAKGAAELAWKRTIELFNATLA